MYRFYNLFLQEGIDISPAIFSYMAKVPFIFSMVSGDSVQEQDNIYFLSSILNLQSSENSRFRIDNQKSKQSSMKKSQWDSPQGRRLGAGNGRFF